MEYKFKDLKEGLEVLDNENRKCIVLKCTDIHNVFLKTTDELGSFCNYACLDPECEKYDPLYKI